MSPRDVAAVEALRALRARARAEYDNNTQPLLVVYAVESFLRRMAVSAYADRMVLKGGMLMAVNEIRRMTKDADLSTHGLANDQEAVGRAVAEICAVTPDPDDGVIFDPSMIKTEAMREGDATTIMLESVLDRPAVPLQAYPFALNLAEKIVTAMQRRETSTRDRDFADLWGTSRRHRLDAQELLRSVRAVAEHRRQSVIPLAEALRDMPDRQTPYAAMVARMGYLAAPPRMWTELLADVIAFVDPLLADGGAQLTSWGPDALRWS